MKRRSTEVFGHLILEVAKVSGEFFGLVAFRLSVDFVDHGLELIGEANAELQGLHRIVDGVFLEETILDGREETVGDLNLECSVGQTDEGESIGAVGVDFEPSASSQPPTQQSQMSADDWAAT